MLGSMAEHFFTNCLTSGEKYKVKFLFKQSRILGSSAHYNGNVFGFKALGKDLLDNLTCRRRIGTGFNNSCITCGNGISKRINRQEKRIVPRTHNKRVTVRYRLLKTMGRKLRKRCIDRLSLSETFGVSNHIRDFGQYKTAFTHKAFIMTFTEIGS